MTVACRSCGREGLDVVLDLGPMPLANRLLSEADLSDPEPRFPLALAFCRKCGLAQITETVSPEVLFREYAYFSSVSDAMVAHAAELVDGIVSEGRLGSDSLVIEVASNDGYLLQHYAHRGIPVLGIDPARNIAEVATQRGIPTLAEFFGADLGRTLAATGRAADVLHANNVIAHVPDLNGFLAGIAAVLKPDGFAVIETPYVRDLVDRLEFDTIYHEHVFYYSLSALQHALARHRLAIADVERIAIHGGSLRVRIAHDSVAAPSERVRELLADERAAGVDDIGYFEHFARRVHERRRELSATLAGLKHDGKRVAGYGAAAKGTILLNAFDIGRETLDFVVDRSPHKQGRYMPGVHVPIRPAEDLLAEQPDVCLLLAWNFADEILAQQAEYRGRGGKFLIPAPTVRLV